MLLIPWIERNEQHIFDALLLFLFCILSLQASPVFGALVWLLFVLQIKFHVLLYLVVILRVQRYYILQVKSSLTGIPD